MQRFMMTMLMLLLAGSVLAVGPHEHDKHHHNKKNVIGQAGQAKAVTRVVQVKMLDSMRFEPSHVTVKRGETVRFLVSNAGKQKHEFILDTPQALAAHYEAMKKYPHMVHDDPNQLTVLPQETKVLIWQFTQAGTVDFACLMLGHFDAGMKGQVMVN